MAEIKLYNYFRSSTSYRVRIALELKNIRFEYKPVHLLNNGGEQNSDSYRKLNPIGGVPTLEHEGRFLSQSLAILEYLDNRFPDTGRLYPNDEYLNAKVKQVCEIINADTHPLHNLKVMKMLEQDFSLTEAQRQKWISHWISNGLRAFEKTIQDYAGDYCFGNQITAADLVLIPQMFSAQRFQVSTSEFSLLEKINSRCLQLAAFEKAHPYRQPDTPPELKLN